MHIDQWLTAVPPLVVYALVGLVIGLESMGVPLPGEVTLISAALLSAQGVVNPIMVGVAASVGAIVGDSTGYAIGRRGGRPLLEKLGRRFPKHFGPAHLAKAESAFHRWGVWAVFVGRFIALLRILAGPLAGALRMRYGRFLAANAAGGVLWAGGTTAVIFSLGKVAEGWLKDFAWIGLLAAIAFGVCTTAYLRYRANKDHGGTEETDDTENAGAVR